jgi:hypothetical protein
VSNAFLMKVVEGFGDLLEKTAAYRFFHLSVRRLLLNVLVQTYSTNVIGDNTYSFGSFN